MQNKKLLKDRLRAQNLAAVHGSFILFENISFRLQAGEILLVKGSNGVGKTTLLKILAQIKAPHQGSVICSDPLIYLGPEQGFKLGMSLFENLRAWQWLYGEEDLSQYLSILKNFGLHPFLFSPCQHLSSGQRQRLHLVKLCLRDAPLWILDEPTVNLDSQGVTVLRSLITHHISKKGSVIVAAPEISWIKGTILNLEKYTHAA